MLEIKDPKFKVGDIVIDIDPRFNKQKIISVGVYSYRLSNYKLFSKGSGVERDAFPIRSKIGKLLYA